MNPYLFPLFVHTLTSTIVIGWCMAWAFLPVIVLPLMRLFNGEYIAQFSEGVFRAVMRQITKIQAGSIIQQTMRLRADK